MADNTFTSGGRTWISRKDPGGKDLIGVYYQDTSSSNTEFNRVREKYGDQFVGEENGKYYVLHSAYELDGNNWAYKPYPPGRETANGNAAQFQTIQNNTALKQQITGSQSPNTSQTNPNQPGTPGGSTSTSEPNKQPANPGGSLVYPNDLASTDQDRIKFQALTYSPKTLPSATSDLFEAVKPVYQTAPGQGAVFLPVQASISDQNAVGWEPDTLNPIEQRAVGMSLDIMKSSTTEDIAQTLSSNLQFAMQQLKATEGAEAIRTYLAGQAVGVNNLLSRLNGQVLNPNLELLFQGPQLRPFNFTFKLSPRNSDEAKTVKQIINYFKKNMAPIVGDAGLFIKAPNIFKVEYQYKNAEHPGINKIKECALTNCSVDYTPLGSYMTYPDGTMVSYTMSLQFQELEPVYSRDYEDGHAIGY